MSVKCGINTELLAGLVTLPATAQETARFIATLSVISMIRLAELDQILHINP
jgi:hypothetical protein